jgi:CheY-like chemotaxis protein
MARILVVDDEAPVRALLRAILAAAGQEVAEAADGAEGVLAYRRLCPDLLFCDLFMPGKNGLEAIRELSAEFPGVKAVAMSGGTAAAILHLLPTARRLGAAWLLPKPFDRKAVLAAVEHVLQGIPSTHEKAT